MSCKVRSSLPSRYKNIRCPAIAPSTWPHPSTSTPISKSAPAPRKTPHTPVRPTQSDPAPPPRGSTGGRPSATDNHDNPPPHRPAPTAGCPHGPPTSVTLASTTRLAKARVPVHSPWCSTASSGSPARGDLSVATTSPPPMNPPAPSGAASDCTPPDPHAPRVPHHAPCRPYRGLGWR
jgi:hypothetical protein